ncbi:MAG: hypothetical protein LBJ17_08735 [Dysgonamonadaceae bacterium]|nr:hypothetical protein [Dysgonamonadaceae bacterium]
MKKVIILILFVVAVAVDICYSMTGVTDIMDMPLQKAFPLPAVLAAASLGASVLGQIKSAEAQREAQRALIKRNKNLKQWFNANAYGDYTQRGDSQATLRNLRNALEKQTDDDSSRAAVTGETLGKQAAAKDIASRRISDTYNNLHAEGQRYRDRVQDVYRSGQDNLANLRAQINGQQQQSAQNLTLNGINAASSMLGRMNFGNTAPAAQTGQQISPGYFDDPDKSYIDSMNFV